MKVIHEAILLLAPQLSKEATKAHILHNLKTGSLISVGKLCDNDCIALFSKYNVQIFKNGSLIIQGTRDATNGLWTIPLSPACNLETPHQSYTMPIVPPTITKHPKVLLFFSWHRIQPSAVHLTLPSPPCSSPANNEDIFGRNTSTDAPGPYHLVVTKHLHRAHLHPPLAALSSKLPASGEPD